LGLRAKVSRDQDRARFFGSQVPLGPVAVEEVEASFGPRGPEIQAERGCLVRSKQDVGQVARDVRNDRILGIQAHQVKFHEPDI
jgi:hypothetical protein